MWEKCVGCGEGLFAGDAFCGNCGRPVTPAVPAAREPDGLESAPLASSGPGQAQVRIIPAAHRTGAPAQASPEQSLPGADRTAQENTAALDGPAQSPGAAPPAGTARENGTTRNDGPRHDGSRHHGTGRHDGPRHDDSRRDGTRRPHDPGRENGAASRGGAVTPGVAAPAPAQGTADEAGPGARGPARRAAAKLSGPMTLDPVRNPRYLMCVLRQAGVFTGLYLLIETVLLLGLLVSAGAGTRLGPALRVELNSLWLIALVLAIPFWLIPVPALLAEWSRVLEQGADATKTAFEHINSAFQAQGTPVDSLRVRAASRREEGDREYLELRRDHFSGYISCFAHERDLYVGWTFWLHMSPLRLLMMIIGRNFQDLTRRGDGIRRSLRLESTRTLVAAMHGATLAGIEAASCERDPAAPQPLRETAIDMHVKLG